MPVYQYICNDCNHNFEELRGISQSDEELNCPECKSKNINRVVSNCSFILKGNGYYMTDYKRHMNPNKVEKYDKM